MTKKYYNKLELIDLDKDAKKASVLLEGKVTKNSDCTEKESAFGKYMTFSVSVQNQTSSLKYIADALGATLNTYSKDDNTWDTINVIANDKPKSKFDYLANQKLQAGDTIILLGVLKPNSFNDKITLQLSNAKLYEVKRRANNVEEVSTNEETEPVVEQAKFTDFDDEDTPF